MTMQPVDVDAVVSAVRLLAAVDLGTCGHGDLDRLAGAAQRVRGFATGVEMAIARRRDDLHTTSPHTTSPPTPSPTADSAPPPQPATVDGLPLDLTGTGGARDRRPAREVERDRKRATVCALLPMFHAALAAGRIDGAHLDAVAAAVADLDDTARHELGRHGEALVGYASVETPERFARRVRDLARRIARDSGARTAERQRQAENVRRWIDARSGMGHLHAELDPEHTARVWAAIDAVLAEVRSQHDTGGIPLGRLEVDALVELVTASSAVDPRVPEISVLVDHATLATGVFGVGSVCETVDGQALAPETVRRLACDAGLLPVVLGGDGVPLDVGRTRRLATRAQRQALAAMYTTCGMPGCGVRFARCRIHHLDPWLPTGQTNLDNLLPVCDRHHHDVHEGGWRLTMTPDRVVTLRAPDGTIRYHGDTRDRANVDDLALDPRHLASTDGDHAGEPDDEWLDDAHTAALVTARVKALARTRCHRHHDDARPDPRTCHQAPPRGGP